MTIRIGGGTGGFIPLTALSVALAYWRKLLLLILLPRLYLLNCIPASCYTMFSEAFIIVSSISQQSNYSRRPANLTRQQHYMKNRQYEAKMNFLLRY
jgi:hypothetical protein